MRYPLNEDLFSFPVSLSRSSMNPVAQQQQYNNHTSSYSNVPRSSYDYLTLYPADQYQYDSPVNESWTSEPHIDISATSSFHDQRPPLPPARWIFFVSFVYLMPQYIFWVFIKIRLGKWRLHTEGVNKKNTPLIENLLLKILRKQRWYNPLT